MFKCKKCESEKKWIEIYTTDYDLAEIIKNTTKDCVNWMRKKLEEV